MCIASGSSYDEIVKCMDLTGINKILPRDKLFSSDLVKHGKPSPDVFLYAADKLKVDAAKCLVVEDSPNGVRAGKAAGMTVFGFGGGSHMNKNRLNNLKTVGADHLFEDMSELLDLITLQV